MAITAFWLASYWFIQGRIIQAFIVTLTSVSSFHSGLTQLNSLSLRVHVCFSNSLLHFHIERPNGNGQTTTPWLDTCQRKTDTDNPNVNTNTEAKMLVSILLTHLEINENFHMYSSIPHSCPRIQWQHISQQQPWHIQQPSNGCWTCEVSILGNKTHQHYL